MPVLKSLGILIQKHKQEFNIWNCPRKQMTSSYTYTFLPTRLLIVTPVTPCCGASIHPSSHFTSAFFFQTLQLLHLELSALYKKIVFIIFLFFDNFFPHSTFTCSDYIKLFIMFFSLCSFLLSSLCTWLVTVPHWLKKKPITVSACSEFTFRLFVLFDFTSFFLLKWTFV